VPLSEQEKVKIRMHAGYPNVTEAASFALGYPANLPVRFVIENAMENIAEIVLPEVRRHLQILDGLQQQMVDDHELLAVHKLGEIEVNEKEQQGLTRRYDWWVDSLCQLFEIARNPYDRRLTGSGAGINARVGT